MNPSVKIIRNGNPGVTVIRQTNIVYVNNFKAGHPVKFMQFSVTASSNGQTQFTLPGTPLLDGLIIVWINGSGQNFAAGDFTVSANILTLNEGIDSGDKVYGFFQTK